MSLTYVHAHEDMSRPVPSVFGMATKSKGHSRLLESDEFSANARSGSASLNSRFVSRFTCERMAEPTVVGDFGSLLMPPQKGTISHLNVASNTPRPSTIATIACFAISSNEVRTISSGSQMLRSPWIETL